MIILGLDPGTTRVGYGLIKTEGSRTTLLQCGLLGITSPSRGGRLKTIEAELIKILKTHQPTIIALEKIYFSKNRKTALAVAEARGVMLLVASRNNIPVFEFGPTEVKRVVAGDGRADKKAIGRVVALTLNLEKPPKPDDVSDALALAIRASFERLTRKTA